MSDARGPGPCPGRGFRACAGWWVWHRRYNEGNGAGLAQHSNSRTQLAEQASPLVTSRQTVHIDIPPGSVGCILQSCKTFAKFTLVPSNSAFFIIIKSSPRKRASMAQVSVKSTQMVIFVSIAALKATVISSIFSLIAAPEIFTQTELSMLGSMSIVNGAVDIPHTSRWIIMGNTLVSSKRDSVSPSYKYRLHR